MLGLAFGSALGFGFGLALAFGLDFGFGLGFALGFGFALAFAFLFAMLALLSNLQRPRALLSATVLGNCPRAKMSEQKPAREPQGHTRRTAG